MQPHLGEREVLQPRDRLHVHLAVFSLAALALLAAPSVRAGLSVGARFCGLARTVNGFDYVGSVHVGCAAALAEVVRIEEDRRGGWNCSRAVGGAIELTCLNGERRIMLLERSPLPARRRGAVVTLANWSFRLVGPVVQGREDGGRWLSLGRAPWCVPDVPREALVALRLRSITAHGGCFVAPAP